MLLLIRMYSSSVVMVPVFVGSFGVYNGRRLSRTCFWIMRFCSRVSSLPGRSKGGLRSSDSLSLVTGLINGDILVIVGAEGTWTAGLSSVTELLGLSLIWLIRELILEEPASDGDCEGSGGDWTDSGSAAASPRLLRFLLGLSSTGVVGAVPRPPVRACSNMSHRWASSGVRFLKALSSLRSSTPPLSTWDLERRRDGPVSSESRLSSNTAWARSLSVVIRVLDLGMARAGLLVRDRLGPGV